MSAWLSLEMPATLCISAPHNQYHEHTHTHLPLAEEVIKAALASVAFDLQTYWKALKGKAQLSSRKRWHHSQSGSPTVPRPSPCGDINYINGIKQIQPAQVGTGAECISNIEAFQVIWMRFMDCEEVTQSWVWGQVPGSAKAGTEAMRLLLNYSYVSGFSFWRQIQKLYYCLLAWQYRLEPLLQKQEDQSFSFTLHIFATFLCAMMFQCPLLQLCV